MKRLVPWLVVLVALAASCAPVPAPRTVSPPPLPGEPAETPPVPVPTPVPAEPVRGEPTITVGMAWDLDSLSIAPLRPLRPQFVGPHGSRPGTDELRDAFTLRPSASGGTELLGSQRDGGGYTVPRGDTLLLVHAGAALPAFRWSGKTWRGSPKVFVNPRGKLTLAVALPLETYLLGVLPYEIGALSEQLGEAGRAQAIAARSYTLFYRGRRATEGFDLFGTVEDQVYGAVDGERPLATRCVETTRGNVALSDNVPIRANYSSTCGGIAAEVWEAWPTPPLPYLVSRLDRPSASGTDFCAASPHYRWREEWTPDELAANVARYGPLQGVSLPAEGVGEIVDVRVTSRSRSGRVWRLEVATTTGRIEIPAYSLRQVLRRPRNPAAILRSNLFKIDVRRDPRTRRALAIVATGGGSGHGVGLCQTGALGMARAGYRGEAILEHYYPGVTLRRLY